MLSKCVLFLFSYLIVLAVRLLLTGKYCCEVNKQYKTKNSRTKDANNCHPSLQAHVLNIIMRKQQNS